MIEVQCTSCHTRYRIDEQVLPEGIPTFKCSRCGHVFSFEPRMYRPESPAEAPTPSSESAAQSAMPLDAPRPEKATGRPGDTAESAQSRVSTELPTEKTVAPARSAPEQGIIEEASHWEAGTPAVPPIESPVEPSSAPTPSPEEEPQPRASGPGETAARESVAMPEQAAHAQLQSREAEKFYSRLLAGKDPTSNEPEPHQENLSFDFADEEPTFEQPKPVSQRGRSRSSPEELEERFSERWRVGDEEPAIAAPSIRDAGGVAEESTSARRRKPQAPRTDELQFAADTEFVDEEELAEQSQGAAHSVRFFLFLVLLVGIGFGAISMLIHDAPASAAVVLSHLPFVGDRFVVPSSPGHLVSVHDVAAVFQRSKDARNALVVNGSAQNVGTNALRTVQLTARLRDKDHHLLATHSVYCGNDMSAAMVRQMTPHEIDFFQTLEPPRTFNLQPLASCRFVVVFVDPPEGLNGYEVSVSRALAEGPATEAEPAS